MVFVVRLQQHEQGRQIGLRVLIQDRLRAALGHRFFGPPVLDVSLDVLFAVELFGEAEAVERADHRPTGDHIF